MDSKYGKMVELLVADLLTKYNIHLSNSQDEFEYCTMVTAALVFKELALFEFRRSIMRNSEDDPDDICKLVEQKALEIAEEIRNRVLPDEMAN